MIATSRTALITFSVTWVLSGIFVPLEALSAPITSAIPKPEDPDEDPEYYSGDDSECTGLGAVSGIESLFIPVYI